MENRIKLYREAKRLSCAQLGLKIGIDRSYVSKLELGHRKPSAEVMFRLACFFDARIEELVAFALHPNSNRLIRISFLYPAGEAAERGPQFAALLGEIEGYD